MDPLETAARAIRTRENRTKELADRERDVKTVPWWDFPDRSYLRSAIATLRTEIETCNNKISKEKVLQLAEISVVELWEGAAKDVIPGRNAFGLAAQSQFGEIFQLALKNRPDLALHISQWPIPVVDLPDVAELLTDEFIESNARRIIAKRLAVAASTVYLTKVYPKDESHTTMVVQHLESSLRARFTVDGSGFGSVFSRSEAIDSIDPNKPGEPDWESYVGLGIGRGIYAEGQRLNPTVRWRSSSPNEYSGPLRRRLHALNPYVWQGPCEWCDVVLPQHGGQGWKSAETSLFATHP